ncbi:YHS domain-containing protein [Tamlana sp. 62-3]|uniref:YHS domain-containing protein n=1 Tax=Neotamlana sargassicola TaxID=2883125 RepID=A0A9X1I490_9FLAO|nr:YHS domain-containing (seleno)protein [Tamlana sargassicola]MCB4807027.1 YHS domain-containing protein [Tamlana sargassicola]
MKLFLALCFLSIYSLQAQQIDYNLKKGYVAEGYDVVSYFKDTPVEGKKELTTTYNGAKFKFSSSENLEKFKQDPERYIPQYGGYCAYAIAEKGEKVGVDPETYQIKDGKLYLFYNSWGINTLKSWEKAGSDKLQAQADGYWQKIKFKKN